MTELLDDMELALTDLIQSGFSTGGPATAQRLGALSHRCEDCGLHTGGALLSELERVLTARSHTVQKNDLPPAAALCRTARYIQLCREKLQEEQIKQRWQPLTDKEEF